MEHVHANAEMGKRSRLLRLFNRQSKKTVIVPVDDSLSSGPFCGLENLTLALTAISEGSPDAILGYAGQLRLASNSISQIPRIINLSASTVHACHTRKGVVGDPLDVLRVDAVAAAVHVNVGSRYEPSMLKMLGKISSQCSTLGLPLLAIMYPRSENGTLDDNYEELKLSDARKYAKLVSHASRIGVDLGADIIKTQYTGDPESFSAVVAACNPIPLVIAGGPVQRPDRVLQIASEAVKVGAAGVSFGRNVFSQPDPKAMIQAIRQVVHDALSPEIALANLVTAVPHYSTHTDKIK